MSRKKQILVLGSGFSGLSAAAYLSRNGYKVTLIEKNNQIGGRARQWHEHGFKFDMGPSWYWMPDIFEKFFSDFDKQVNDFYDLVKLNPSFQIIYNDGDIIQVPSSSDDLAEIIEKYEKNGKKNFLEYIQECKWLYEASIKNSNLLYKPYIDFTDYLDKQTLKLSLIKSLFYSVSQSVRKRFKHPKIVQLLEFPVIFLGATANEIPALYNLMNYAAFELGTWYPMGGMIEISNAIHKIALQNGVEFSLSNPVRKIVVKNNRAIGVETEQGFYECDAVVSSIDYAFTDSVLLEHDYSNYDENYWNSRKFAPSALIFYLGVNKPLPKLLHHNLFFDADFDKHISTVYKTHEWPENPLFYLSVPSKTDDSVAPKNHENLFVLIPISIGLNDNAELHNRLFENVIKRIESFVGESFRENIVVKRLYSVSDFKSDYNSFKGNAYGLANTLFQTATFKPKMINKKIPNLFYTGQLTVPGPGVPPSLISGQIAAQLVDKYFNDNFKSSIHSINNQKMYAYEK